MAIADGQRRSSAPFGASTTTSSTRQALLAGPVYRAAGASSRGCAAPSADHLLERDAALRRWGNRPVSGAFRGLPSTPMAPSGNGGVQGPSEDCGTGTAASCRRRHGNAASSWPGRARAAATPTPVGRPLPGKLAGRAADRAGPPSSSRFGGLTPPRRHGLRPSPATTSAAGTMEAADAVRAEMHPYMTRTCSGPATAWSGPRARMLDAASVGISRSACWRDGTAALALRERPPCSVASARWSAAVGRSATETRGLFESAAGLSSGARPPISPAADRQRVDYGHNPTGATSRPSVPSKASHDRTHHRRSVAQPVTVASRFARQTSSSRRRPAHR